MNRITLSLVVALLLGTSVANADTVVLKDGRTLEGKTEWTPDGKHLRIKLKMGELLVPKKDVVRLETKQTPAEEFQKRRDALDPADLEAMLSLVTFCTEHNEIRKHAPGLLVNVVTSASAAEKANAGDGEQAKKARMAAFRNRGRAEAALLALDYHSVAGSWVAPEDYYPQRGFVKVGDKWVSADEAKGIAAAKGKRAAARQARKDGAKAKKVGKAQDAWDKAEAEQEKAERRIAHYESEQERVGQESINAKAEVDRRYAERVEAEGLERVARSAYDAWNGQRCDCTGFCNCGWNTHLTKLQTLKQDAEKLASDTRGLETQAKRKLADLTRDAASARAFIKEARKKLAVAKRALKAADKKLSKTKDN